jgi:mRNA-degrading endonuclease toxin of MazEF toxin-antitoxin module
VVWVELDPARGAKQAGRRPALVIASDHFAGTVDGATMTEVDGWLRDFLALR